MIIEEEDYLVHEYLEHFGKKGMKWGVRNTKRLKTNARTAASVTGKAINKTVHDETFLRVLRTGAIITAAILTGGVGGMAVASLTTQVGSPGKLVPLVKHI